jgi:hypothetical protein
MDDIEGGGADCQRRLYAIQDGSDSRRFCNADLSSYRRIGQDMATSALSDSSMRKPVAVGIVGLPFDKVFMKQKVGWMCASKVYYI